MATPVRDSIVEGTQREDGGGNADCRKVMAHEPPKSTSDPFEKALWRDDGTANSEFLAAIARAVSRDLQDDFEEDMVDLMSRLEHKHGWSRSQICAHVIKEFRGAVCEQVGDC